jgi:hypothetical protein
LGTVEQHEGQPRPQLTLAEQDDGVTDRPEAPEEAFGSTGAGNPQEAVAEGGVGLDGSLDLPGRRVRVAQLLDDPQACELAGGKRLALDDLGAAQKVALVEVEAELLTGAQLLAGLDLLGYQFHVEGRTVVDRVRQLGRCQRQDVELDDRDQVEQRVVVVLPDVVVESEPVAAFGQPAAARDHLRIASNVFEDLDHRLRGGEGELVLADQEGAGGVDKGQFAAHEAAQPDVEAGVHQDVGRHRIAVLPRTRGVPEK